MVPLGSCMSFDGHSAREKWEKAVYEAFDRFQANEDCEKTPGKSECPLCYQGAPRVSLTPRPVRRMSAYLPLCVVRPMSPDYFCPVCKFHHDWIIPAAREQFKWVPPRGAFKSVLCRGPTAVGYPVNQSYGLLLTPACRTLMNEALEEERRLREDAKVCTHAAIQPCTH